MGQRRKIKRHQTFTNVQPSSTALKIVAYLCFFVGLSSFWWIAQFEMDNTINGAGFFVLFAIVGVVISIPFYFLMYKTIPELKKRQKINKQWNTFLSCLGLGFFFMFPAIASNINKTYFIKSENCNEYKVIEKSYSVRKGPSHYFSVIINNKEESFRVTALKWETLQVGQNVKLCLRKGLLDVDYIVMQQ